MSKPGSISPEIKELSKLSKEEWREYTKTVWHIANVSHPNHPAVFPLEIPKRLTKLFSYYGESVLDPFGGAGTTAEAAISLGRDAICVEQNADYAAIIEERCLDALRANPERNLTVIEGDSRDLSQIEDDSVSLVITSPPYWDKADYGNNASNLGMISHYSRFIESTAEVWRECIRVLKPGRKLCLVTANVNQHTDQGLLTFPLATDFAVLLRELGMVMVNEIIWSKDGTGGRWGSANSQRPIFGSYPYPPNLLFKNVHEYILIFAKTNTKITKGKTVKPYRELIDLPKKS